MKSIGRVFIVLLLLTNSVHAQSWKDSLRMGNELYKNGEFSQAYQTLLHAQKLAPEGVDLSPDIGNAAYRNQEMEVAEKAYSTAVQKEENKTVKASQWHNLGNTQMQTENYKSAIESYKNSLRLNPNNNETRYNLAEAMRRMKQQEEQEQNNQNQDDSQNQEGDKQQDSSDSSQQKDDSSEGDKQKENQQNNSGNRNQNQPNENEGKLSDGKTDRILDDLLKQEIKTHKKVQGIDSNTDENPPKSGKRW